ncbi:TATA-binding protein, putative [Perkinsus marinus ATCC 50983]|uniref:TATA-binding protein, putative n=1 Tax=Perkinsus marinus (strain ATCC 50983 / TXsc) TaxID=423536 RepID=C5KMP7_PERM5|nr:TATA-binding protein, putative [Perkinsus marinus ATCC 50983]EER14205.1 TATA-binding protein, putative [Perkinsus marinus ATCC 50983]|eukprot:XP_002782410.1 TATA-binding protein, putative [Perkinsus marinus ATCC 50983]
MLSDFDIDSLLGTSNKQVVESTLIPSTDDNDGCRLYGAREDNHETTSLESSNNDGLIMASDDDDVGYDGCVIPETVYPVLENVIASVELGIINSTHSTTTTGGSSSSSSHLIDLKKVAFKARNAEYNPRKVNAVVIRFRDPKATAMLYGTGKVMVTGSNSEETAKDAAKKVAKIVIKSGAYPQARFRRFKIENMVASADVRFPIRLEALAYEHRSYCSYEPELYPGLVFRLFEPKVALLIFVSGKIVFTGAKNRDDITNAFRNIYPLLLKYQN